MGRRGSTRWRHHAKRPLVENTSCLDLASSELKWLLQHHRLHGQIAWKEARTGLTIFSADFYLSSPEDDASRLLVLDLMGDPYEPKEKIRVEWAKAGFTNRWLAHCPRDCGRRAQKLYLTYPPPRLSCWRCAGLTHRSAQEHDSRLDLARRDPPSFIRSREEAPHTLRSKCITAELHFRSRRFNLQQYKGRGWGRKSNVYLLPVPGHDLRKLQTEISQKLQRQSLDGSKRE